MLLEKGPGYGEGLRSFLKHLNPGTIGTGVVAAIMGCTGPAVMILSAAQAGKLTEAQAASWVFSVYFFGGLISLILALYYRQPICGAWSIPGALLIGAVLSKFQWEQAAGAYLFAGVAVLLLGLTGYVKKVMLALPQPIVMGMIAGAMFRFGTGMAAAIPQLPVVVLLTIAGWILLTIYIKRVPGVVGALVFGIGSAIALRVADLSKVTFSFARPIIVTPQFSGDAILSIGIPLAVMVIAAENTQAMGVLMSQGYEPPINTMTIISGVGGIVTSFFGGHNANIAGPMTAICSGPESGDREGRYVASVIDGLLFGGFGLIAGAAASFVAALPPPLISAVVGLSMIGVLTSAFSIAFSGKFRLGAFFALVIAASGIVVAKIGAPFWALLGGALVSLLLERKDFASMREAPGAAGGAARKA